MITAEPILKQSEVNTEELKAKYGEVFQLNVYLPDEVVTAYLKKPSRAILGAVMSKVNSDPMLANELLLKNCIIREVSDLRVLENDELFISAMNSLEGLVQLYKSDLKKI